MSKEKVLKNQQGFIALISVVIIFAVLLVISVSIGTTSFFSRFNVAEAEYKKRSSALAEACVDIALLRLAQNPTDTTTGSVNVGSDSCTVYSVQLNSPSTGQTIIQSKATFQQSVTNIQVIVNSNNFSIVSWEELASL